MTGILNILAGSISSAIKDGYFNLVSLLLPGNGTNGAQNNTFLDSSTNNFTITRNGNTTQGTFSPFSQTGWSNYFDGTGDYLTGTITAVNNTTMTMECWIYFIARDDVNSDHLLQVDNGANTNYAITHNGNGSARFLSRNNTGVAIFDLTSANNVLQNNRWHHIVGVRNASAASLYVDGTRVATVSSPSVSSTDGTSLYVASNGGGGREPNGYISNARIVSGTAVYDPTSSSLTVPTSPLTAVSGTRILTCQSNRFIDNSSNAFAITVNGTPSVQAFSPFAPTAAYSTSVVGGSGYFDGSGDYLTVTGSSLNPNGVNYTADFWIFPTSYPNANCAIFQIGSTGTGDMQCLLINTGKIRFQIGGTLGSEANITLNQWQYITCVKSGSNFTVYVNNVAGTTVALTPNSATTMYIGAQSSGTSPFAGYISNFRITSGAANIPSSIPTVPSTTTVASGTCQLLLSATNAGIYDATAKNVSETVGNAQVSTTQAKFGTTSMYFDGTGDYLIIPYNKRQDLTQGDFTVEGWFYRAATGVEHNILNNRGANIGILWRINAANTVTFSIQGSTITTITSTGTIAANTWTYIAVTRSGANLRIFINGTIDGSSASAVNGTSSTVTLKVGCDDNLINAFNGYMDELRVTNGYARYTANFSVPTAAFPVQ